MSRWTRRTFATFSSIWRRSRDPREGAIAHLRTRVDRLFEARPSAEHLRVTVECVAQGQKGRELSEVFQIDFQFLIRCSAVRHASACAVSVGLCAPLVPMVEAPRIPRFGTSWAKPQRLTTFVSGLSPMRVPP